jgi:hypothetical protein
MPPDIINQPNNFPPYLSHYYEADIGPFVNLSDIPIAEAEACLAQIRKAGQTLASQRSVDYLSIRKQLEAEVRNLFIQKGGKPARKHPHYMILGSCPWVLSWYQDGRELRIPLDQFSSKNISFTYGDTFPAMRYQDDRSYRGQVYCLEELPGLVLQFGLPQDWNPDGKLGPDRYIEAQIWDDTPLKPFQ